MKKFEYRIETIDISSNYKEKIERQLLDKLNSIGDEGWELSGVNGPMLYFKREVIS